LFNPFPIIQENVMLKKFIVALAIAGPLAASAPALAQKAGPNGGIVSGKAGHETELVIGATDLTVYVLHDGKADDVTGTALKAVIQDGGKTTTVAFAAASPTKLVAKLPAALGKGAIVVLTGKDHHGDAISARHVVK
jgi:hypothetical protein